MDEKFRRKVADKLPDSHKGLVPLREMPDSTQFPVVYGIISDVPGPLDIPFFSKVSFRNARRKLRSMRYPVIFQKIEEITPLV